MDKALIERVAATVKALEPELKELTMNIHDNPELGNQEFKAYAWQLELLKKYGFEIVLDGAIGADVIGRHAPAGVRGFVLGTSLLFGKEDPYDQILKNARKL